MTPPSSWIEAAARRGILSSRYPREAATPAEVPETARAPALEPGLPGRADRAEICPVGAIAFDRIDQGLCIRCGRCVREGYRFSGPAEATTFLREDLIEPRDGAGVRRGEAGPLRALGRSIHVFFVDAGSCNACNLEVLAIANPYYDATRLGIFFTNSPRHADVLLVVGVPTEAMVEPVRRAYEALPSPKAVLAVGACPISGGVFRGNPGLAHVLSDVVPVDAFVPGCPPTPVNVLDGLLRLAGRGRPREAP